MNAIYKYPLPVREKHTILLPVGARFIRVEDVDGEFFIWAMVNTAPDAVTQERFLELYKTGQEILTNPDHLNFLGTCKLFIAQELCLYVFENTHTGL